MRALLPLALFAAATSASAQDVEQTPANAHRFFELVASQNTISRYASYAAWPTFGLYYKVKGMTGEGCESTIEAGTAFVALPNSEIVPDTSPQYSDMIAKVRKQANILPPPWRIDWSLVSSITLTGPHVKGENDSSTVVIRLPEVYHALRFSDKAIAKRAAYAAEFLKSACDKTAETGF